MTTAEYF